MLVAELSAIEEELAAENHRVAGMIGRIAQAARSGAADDDRPEVRLAASALRSIALLALNGAPGLDALAVLHGNLPIVGNARAEMIRVLRAASAHHVTRRRLLAETLRRVANRPDHVCEPKPEVDPSAPMGANVESAMTRAVNVSEEANVVLVRMCLTMLDRRFERLDGDRILRALTRVGRKLDPVAKVAARLSLACGAFGDRRRDGEHLADAEVRVAKIFRKHESA